MKKILFLAIIIALFVSCSLIQLQDQGSAVPTSTNLGFSQERELAKENAPTWPGRVQLYYSAGHKYLYFEYSLSEEIGRNYSHFTRNGTHYQWNQVNGPVVMWLNFESYNCKINKENHTIWVKIPTKRLLKEKITTVHFSWVVNGKYYSLVNYSPFSCFGNNVNEDYHFEAKLLPDFEIIAYEDY